MQNLLQRTIQSHKVFYRYFRRKGFKRFFRENILQAEGSNKVKSLSVALGIFVGLTPLWGFHTLVVLFLAALFKLNKLIAYMCTHVSFPPLIPFIIMASLWVGAPFVHVETDLSQMHFTMQTVKDNLVQYLVGSTILAFSASALVGFLTLVILNWLSPEHRT